MKTKSAKRAKPNRKPARDIFGEIMEGVAALAQEREGKMTLHTHAIE